MVKSPTKNDDPYADLDTGDNVKHPKFGEGTIMQRTGSYDKTKFIVAFAEEGQKHLLACCAKLKKVQPIKTSEEEEANDKKAE